MTPKPPKVKTNGLKNGLHRIEKFSGCLAFKKQHVNFNRLYCICEIYQEKDLPLCQIIQP
jgi:hypothetical protein